MNESNIYRRARITSSSTNFIAAFVLTANTTRAFLAHGARLTVGFVGGCYTRSRYTDVPGRTIGVGSRTRRVTSLGVVALVRAATERRASSLGPRKIAAGAGPTRGNVTAHAVYAISAGTFEIAGTRSTQNLGKSME